MPLPRPILDNRSYPQIRDELIGRIKVYAPEWTDHNPSDPGIALLELFAFLGENLLYRFNQIPETARLEFLQLLQIPLRPAQPARAIVVVTTDTLAAPLVPDDSELRAGAVAFTVATEVRALPLEARAVAKAKSDPPGPQDDAEVVEFYRRTLDAMPALAPGTTPACYQNAVVSDGSGPPVDFATAVDSTLWLACLAAGKATPDAVRTALVSHSEAPLVANIGFIPDPEVPIGAAVDPCPGTATSSGGPAVEWQIASKLDADRQPTYRSLRVLADTTRGLTQAGVVRLALPKDLDQLGTFALDDPDLAGTGQFPPALDDETAARVVLWLRAFRPDGTELGKVAFIGLNAAEVVQQRPARAEYLGTGTGQPRQRAALVHKPVLSGSLTLEVEEDGGWRPWQEVDGFHHSVEGDRHYTLDAEAGEVRFGDGIHGLTPQIGQRIRARVYRYGGGIDGNVAAGALSRLVGVPGVKVRNPFPASGGAAGESIAEALERIPGELRRRDRAVTAGDFAELARMTPGADIGRAECLPRFYPKTRRSETPGVVSVVVWPREDRKHPNAPTPDRATLRAVCAHLDRRRLVTTELYVIPPTYRRIAVAVGLQVQPGHGIETVRRWVELALRQYLAPLPPYGPGGQGWPLGRRVHGPELEAAALQVEGVEYLESLAVAGWDDTKGWSPGTVKLALDEVPELVEITVVQGPAREPGATLEPAAPTGPIVPVPIVREEC
ncbi:putative baseplate assembly protein [Nannocystis sp.]|uniref:putative baseplate assembly protein n=1 Tax=Nannocystis sp. TaxID=1962667 RepID=UPI0025FCD7F4|nr:putative baseplate assembly protein [Nannocystis sp.]MBK7823657.1 putative baseplate assembly protein [Nannocystis sp.]